jgi:low affinity Fe/Cu permease
MINRPWFESIAERTAKAAGHPITFVCCGLLILVWGTSGPIFHFSGTWQLVINTSTTIVTFLMVFLLQNSQNREMKALHVKVDEIIRSGAGNNKVIALQEKTEREIVAAAEEIKETIAHD